MTAPFSRLARFAVAALLAAVLVGVPIARAQQVAAADSFAVARDRWLAHLTGGADFDPTAEPYRAAVDRITQDAQTDWESMTPGSAELWGDLSSATRVADLHQSYIRLREMALAYRTHGSARQADPALLAAILAGLDQLNATRYNTTTKQDASTWYWALGIPMELNDISVLLFGALGTKRIAAYMAAEAKFLPHVYTTGPYSTGANRAWSVKVIALRAVLLASDTKAREARDGLPPILAYVTAGDGFYAGGGFIQHTTIPYVGGYGISALELSAEVMYLFFTTPWAVADPVRTNLYDAVRTTFAPFMVNGVMMDAVRGREISREYRSDRDAGSAVIRAIAVLAESAPAMVADQLRSGVKSLLLAADLDAYRASSSVSELEQSAAILGDAARAPAAALSGAFAFPSMDRFVHQGPGYAFAVSASSARISNFETADAGENQKAWYTADGMTYLYSNTTAQYTSSYWATVNRYRLPGTTVDTRVKGVNDGRNYRSRQSFTGGLAAPSGAFGTYAMVLDAPSSSLAANKAWFTFDDEIVALGNSIIDPGLIGSGWDGAAKHVETIVEDRRAEDSAQSLQVDGKSITSSTATSFANPSWAQVVGASGAIGYIFPGSESLRAAKTVNTGTWFAVNAKNGSTTPRTDTYFALWVDHGKAPANATYSYVVLPGSTLTATKAYAASPETTVLANTAAVSAVKETTRNAVGAIFWTDAAATASVGGRPFLTSSAKSVVMTEESGSGISLTVTDPTQARVGSITIELDRAATGVGSLSPGITVQRLSPTIILDVDVTSAQGRTFSAAFRY